MGKGISAEHEMMARAATFAALMCLVAGGFSLATEDAAAMAVDDVSPVPPTANEAQLAKAWASLREVRMLAHEMEASGSVASGDEVHDLGDTAQSGYKKGFLRRRKLGGFLKRAIAATKAKSWAHKLGSKIAK